MSRPLKKTKTRLYFTSVRPSAFIRTSISTSVDIQQLSYGLPSILLWTSINFYGRLSVLFWTTISFHSDIQQYSVDVNQYLHGHPSVFIRMSIKISVDVHHLSYGHITEPLWVSISFHTDVHQRICCHLRRICSGMLSYL